MYSMQSSVICFWFFFCCQSPHVSLGIATGVEPFGSSNLSGHLASRAATLVVYKVKSNWKSCSQFLKLLIVFLFPLFCIQLTNHPISQSTTNSPLRASVVYPGFHRLPGSSISWLASITSCLTCRLACHASNNQASPLCCSEDHSIFLEPTGLFFRSATTWLADAVLFLIFFSFFIFILHGTPKPQARHLLFNHLVSVLSDIALRWMDAQIYPKISATFRGWTFFFPSESI